MASSHQIHDGITTSAIGHKFRLFPRFTRDALTGVPEAMKIIYQSQDAGSHTRNRHDGLLGRSCALFPEFVATKPHLSPSKWLPTVCIPIIHRIHMKK